MVRGIYRHYKGGVYEVVGLAVHENVKEELVLYRSTNPELATLWARPRANFSESVEVDGAAVPRFELLDEAVPDSTDAWKCDGCALGPCILQDAANEGSARLCPFAEEVSRLTAPWEPIELPEALR